MAAGECDDDRQPQTAREKARLRTDSRTDRHAGKQGGGLALGVTAAVVACNNIVIEVFSLIKIKYIICTKILVLFVYL